MALTSIIVGLLATQAAVTLPGNDAAFEQTEVAYEALAQGRTDQAIAVLEAKLAQMPNDPATLINLGTAYARLGQLDRAGMVYRAALASDTHYQLELADGRWVDSRNAARQALHGLDRSLSLAALSD